MLGDGADWLAENPAKRGKHARLGRRRDEVSAGDLWCDHGGKRAEQNRAIGRQRTQRRKRHTDVAQLRIEVVFNKQRIVCLSPRD